MVVSTHRLDIKNSKQFISFIRDYTGILDETTLFNIKSRFEEFCTKQSLVLDVDAFKMFWKPISYIDFLSIMQGKTIILDNKEYKLLKPCYFDDGKVSDIFGPEYAYAYGKPRFGTWASPSEVPYPVDADLRIQIVLSGKDICNHIYLSYNEIAGLCSSGRDIHWSEPWTYKSQSPSNSYLASLGNNFLSDPLYRTTPKNQPTVANLIKIGTIVKASYSDAEYIVSQVKKFTYQPIERPESHIFDYYSLNLIDRKTGSKGYIINELVAVNGRILKLFMANQEEVYILNEVNPAPLTVLNSKDCIEDEEDEECCLFESDNKQDSNDISHTKGIQLTLF